MKKPFKIGKKEYKFKKDAVKHYQSILNSYNFGQSLSNSDFNDLIDLLDYDYFNYLADIETAVEDNDQDIQLKMELAETNEKSEVEIKIADIKVAKVQFNTKCFEVIYSDKSSEYISYLMIINKAKYTPEKLFNIACRSSIHNDIHTVKQHYFDKNSSKGKVKCQETGILSKWNELVVDHRQPNTFSIIVDRFKEVNKIDLDLIGYKSNDQNHIVFEDDKWTEGFKKYHKDKASLRIVRVECNSSRIGMARIKRMKNDLTIE